MASTAVNFINFRSGEFPTPALARVHDDLAAMYDRMAREAERELEFELTE